MERVEIWFISLEGGREGNHVHWISGFFKGVRGKASEGNHHAATPPFLWSTRVPGPTSTYSISKVTGAQSESELLLVLEDLFFRFLFFFFLSFFLRSFLFFFFFLQRRSEEEEEEEEESELSESDEVVSWSSCCSCRILRKTQVDKDEDVGGCGWDRKTVIETDTAGWQASECLCAQIMGWPSADSIYQ